MPPTPAMQNTNLLTMEETRQHLQEDIPEFEITLAAALGIERKELYERIQAGHVTKLETIAVISRLAITRASSTELARAAQIETAARNLVAQKGRYNTQQAYERLAALLSMPAAPSKEPTP